jgi:hypothetical protein
METTEPSPVETTEGQKQASMLQHLLTHTHLCKKEVKNKQEI